MGKKFFLMKSQTVISSFELDLLRGLISKTVAKRNGMQYPNPSVGAMIIKDNKVISEGYHLVHGDAHAEVNALSLAGDHASGSTLLVTLEPCTHTGKTPPCVDAIIRANVSRVIWALDDPNPTTSGRAIGRLQAHNIDVVAHCIPDEARRCCPEFYSFYAHKRPYIYVKAAISLDGMIAPDAHGLTYISSSQSLMLVHQLRSYVQAICVGARTIGIDQPQLSVRMGIDVNDQPRIVILDPHNCVDMAWVERALNQGRRIVLFRSIGVEFSHALLIVDVGLTEDKRANWAHVFSVLYGLNVHGVFN